MNAFDRLHPAVQEAIWKMQWPALRPLQVDAINAIFETEDHLILAAATASGKTEAAFLPLLSKIAENPNGSIKILYVSPLKALINDQFSRINDLCEQSDIPVHRWHGDVSATDKKRMREKPGGVLLITPESIESQFVNYGLLVPHLYQDLQYIVIDELHAFLDDIRGIHLLSLIRRIVNGSGCTPRLLGLSATLGDFAPAKQYFSPENSAAVTVIEDSGPRKALKLGLKGYTRKPKHADSGDEILDDAEVAVAADLAKRFRSTTNLIFCNSRAHVELFADLLNTRANAEHWPWNPFVVHHGSLSKDLREDTEKSLKSGRETTALCTATLEMGIDIGSVHSVGQVGPPWTVSSLVQRLGRSGRGEGEDQILRLYTIDESITEKSDTTQRIYPHLLQAVAMVRLALSGWVEAPNSRRYHFSTCVHQILSILKQTGGCQAASVYHSLCDKGAFRRIDAKQFSTLLRGLGVAELIQQIETGEIILAQVGERITANWDFYAAFLSNEEYSIETRDGKIGMLAVIMIPPVGEHTILAGRRWRITEIDAPSKRVLVEPSRGRKAPLFLGRSGGLSARVMQEMGALLRESESAPTFLDSNATVMLTSAQKYWRNLPGNASGALFSGKRVEWFPWAGTNAHRTLAFLLKTLGHQVETHPSGLSLAVSVENPNALIPSLERITQAEPRDLSSYTAETSIGFNPEKFDEFVPAELLQIDHLESHFDLDSAKTAALDLLDGIH
ncbi:MAG: DEAD/DEAH box helicase [Verrucomicrobiales bacterium]|jgi:ATP-dependent Lhr-like helicase|nr:DEAD/DEAH box helicase [Verrucomicrobiales bacterium]